MLKQRSENLPDRVSERYGDVRQFHVVLETGVGHAESSTVRVPSIMVRGEKHAPDVFCSSSVVHNDLRQYGCSLQSAIAK